MAMQDDPQLLSALAGLLLQLSIRQIAIIEVLLQQPGVDEQTIRDAVKRATDRLHKIPQIATLRSRASGQRLEELEKILRSALFPPKT